MPTATPNASLATGTTITIPDARGVAKTWTITAGVPWSISRAEGELLRAARFSNAGVPTAAVVVS